MWAGEGKQELLEILEDGTVNVLTALHGKPASIPGPERYVHDTDAV